VLHLLLGGAERYGERPVELAHDRHPFQPSLRNVVEALLHVGGEINIHDLREVLDEEVVDDGPQLRRLEPLVGSYDIAALLEG